MPGFCDLPEMGSFVHFCFAKKQGEAGRRVSPKRDSEAWRRWGVSRTCLEMGSFVHFSTRQKNRRSLACGSHRSGSRCGIGLTWSVRGITTNRSGRTSRCDPGRRSATVVGRVDESCGERAWDQPGRLSGKPDAWSFEEGRSRAKPRPPLDLSGALSFAPLRHSLMPPCPSDRRDSRCPVPLPAPEPGCVRRPRPSHER
jgi:hypothetical protein